MLRTFFESVKQAGSEWIADNVLSRGAALAYYSMFAFIPIVVFVVLMAGLYYGKDAANGRVAQQIESTAGPQVGSAIESIVRTSQNQTSSQLATALSLAIGLFGAAGAFTELQDALNTIWKVMPRPGRPFWTLVKERAFSFLMVLAVGILLLVSVVVTAALSALAGWVSPDTLPGGVALWRAVNALVSFAFVTLLFALIFKIVPDVRIDWRDAWAGAALAALLFTIGKYLLGIYLMKAGVASAYGAAGSLAVVLVWVYYSALILLFGVEFSRAEARRHCAECGPTRSAVPMTPDALVRRGIAPRPRPESVAPR